MSNPMEDRVAAMTARLQATEKAIARAQGELDAASASSLSSDRTVRAVVGAQGELTTLEFLDGKYRSMAAAQLSASVLEAVNAARAEMTRQVMETFDPIFRTNPGAGPGNTDISLESFFGSLLGETLDERKSTEMSRFRDEIVEDEEVPVPPSSARGAVTMRREGY